MIPQDLYDAAGLEAATLADAAGPAPLLAAAADSRLGLDILADLLAHEIAAGHRLMLRLAAAAQDILDWAAGNDADRESAEASAARLSAASSRLMEQVRQALALLRRLRPGTAEQAAAWLTPHGSLAANDPEPAAASAEAERAKALRAGAAAPADRLAELAGVQSLCKAAADPAIGPSFLTCLFGHELGTAHVLMMRLAGLADAALARAKAAAREPAHALRLVDLNARLADRYRRGLASLARFAGATAGHGVLRAESQAAA